MVIVVGISGWQDAELLAGAVDSVRSLRCPIVYADGTYPLYAEPGQEEETDPIAVSAALAGTTAHVLRGVAWPDEASKKAAIVMAARELHPRPEWLLYLDTDERFEGFALGLQTWCLTTGEDWGYLQIYRPDHGWAPQGFPIPRLLRLTDGLTFRGPGDYTAWDGDRRVAFLDGEPGASGGGRVPWSTARIRHERRARPQARHDQNGRYQVRRREVTGWL